MKTVAVIPCRMGDRCIGAADAVALADGHVIEAHAVHFDAVAMALALAPLVSGCDAVVLAGSADSRDLAPHLALALDAELLSGVIRIDAGSVTVGRYGGRCAQTFRRATKVVAVLQAGLGFTTVADTSVQVVEISTTDSAVVTLEQLPADPATMDLVEAPRILGAGIGLGSEESVEQLSDLAALVGASVGGTRVITDLGWLPFSRQIGTTGVSVDPRLYINFGVSGAVQHTTGLGQPAHIISVNTDASCPMMGMADLAVVADASAVLRELIAQLGDGSD